MTSHLSRHMEDIATTAIPQDITDIDSTISTKHSSYGHDGEHFSGALNPIDTRPADNTMQRLGTEEDISVPGEHTPDSQLDVVDSDANTSTHSDVMLAYPPLQFVSDTISLTPRGVYDSDFSESGNSGTDPTLLLRPSSSEYQPRLAAEKETTSFVTKGCEGTSTGECSNTQLARTDLSSPFQQDQLDQSVRSPVSQNVKGGTGASHHMSITSKSRDSADTTGRIPSSTLGKVGVTPSSDPSVLKCPIEGCEAQFTGIYRRGNQRRHFRLIHNTIATLFPCGVPGCCRTFNRQDARLKHRRKHHAYELPSLKPPSSRKCSTGKMLT